MDTQYGERMEQSLEQPVRETSAGEPVTDRPDQPAGDAGAREPERTETGEQGTGGLRVRKRIRIDDR